MTLFDAAQVQALLDVERQRSLGFAQQADSANATVQRFRNLIAAYGMLGRERGFTEQNARDCWKKAGYGGL